MNRVITALLVASTFVVATAGPAAAESQFGEFRQAAGAQYGGNPPAEEPGELVPEEQEGSGTEGEGNQGGPGGGGGGQGGGNAAAASVSLTASLVFLSPVDPAIVDGVTKVLHRLGEPRPRVLSLIEPLNIPGIAAASAGTRYTEISERRLGLIRALGRRVATELAKPSPFFGALGPVLLSVEAPLTAQKYLIFARSGGRLATRAATRARNAFEDGLAQGARKLRRDGIEINGEQRKIPIAGVETTQTEPSQIRWYKKRKIPSVDNVETVNGQRALYEILRLRAKGHYGVKDTAQRLLPKGISADNAAATLDGESDAGLGTGLMLGILLLMGAFTTLTAARRMRRSRSSR